MVSAISSNCGVAAAPIIANAAQNYKNTSVVEKTPVLTSAANAVDTVEIHNPIKAEAQKNDYRIVIIDKPSTAKKWGVGLAAALFLGLGQAVNGQWGKAAGFFFGGHLLTAALLLTCPPLGVLAALALYVASIADAVKNV